MRRRWTNLAERRDGLEWGWARLMKLGRTDPGTDWDFGALKVGASVRWFVGLLAGSTAWAQTCTLP